MEIQFEWRTRKLDEAKKSDIEGLIKQKIPVIVKNCAGKEVHSLLISLTEEDSSQPIVKGIVSALDEGAVSEVAEVTINSGFMAQCKGFGKDFSLYEHMNKL